MRKGLATGVSEREYNRILSVLIFKLFYASVLAIAVATGIVFFGLSLRPSVPFFKMQSLKNVWSEFLQTCLRCSFWLPDEILVVTLTNKVKGNFTVKSQYSMFWSLFSATAQEQQHDRWAEQRWTIYLLWPILSIFSIIGISDLSVRLQIECTVKKCGNLSLMQHPLPQQCLMGNVSQLIAYERWVIWICKVTWN